MPFSWWTSPEIKQRKDEHPNQIDEVPVQAGDLDDLVISGALVAPLQDPGRNDAQVDHADGDVQSVKAGDHEERRAELRRAPRVAPRTHAFVDQLAPLEDLHADEGRAQG